MLGIDWIKSGIKESRKKKQVDENCSASILGFSSDEFIPWNTSRKKKSSKWTRNPERAFTGSREVGGNLVPQNKTRRMKQVTTFFLVWDDLKPRI